MRRAQARQSYIFGYVVILLRVYWRKVTRARRTASADWWITPGTAGMRPCDLFTTSRDYRESVGPKELRSYLVSHDTTRFLKYRDAFITITGLHDIDEIELNAFLELLLCSVVFKSNHDDCDLLFTTDVFFTLSKERVTQKGSHQFAQWDDTHSSDCKNIMLRRYRGEKRGCPLAFTPLMTDTRPMSERVRLLLLAHMKNDKAIERAASK
ncbi:hypothetical protein EVAR_11358_1 [Eumeta japonica]|uniref:Uncharacterized protein n=1 Tax=Eumeta variegata TaxID=151549 RepID=A0A4C1U163_EUMVA|nr:hypothetical protein EVAR_11358_1 [Eumeta japonica]